MPLFVRLEHGERHCQVPSTANTILTVTSEPAIEDAFVDRKLGHSPHLRDRSFPSLKTELHIGYRGFSCVPF